MNEYDVEIGDECVFLGDFERSRPFLITRIIKSTNPYSQTWYFVDGIFYDGETVSRVSNYSIIKTGRSFPDVNDLLSKIKGYNNA